VLIPMSELVKDPVYKRFLETQPLLPPIARNPEVMSTPPWVVYVQRELHGPWGKREFWRYGEAFRFMAKALRLRVADVTIHCRRVGFEPPSSFARVRGKFIVGSDGVKRQATRRVYWKPHLLPEDPDHHWCMYCRRPVEFNYYRKHKAVMGVVDSTTPRCCICGASVRIAIHRPSDRGFRHK
jgi:hypothetical protein